ncbi:MAG: valine--tRNA ligase [Acidobacteria bacterium RBG_16_70_10]|nr:MAG: valine--tRNA ligase [Acidobacteria bacterium RBG_16_70_10]
MGTLDASTLGPHFDSKAAEEKWDRLWEEWGVHRFDEAAPGPTFVIDTPPPTVSGSLHVGHVFSYAQTDVLARHQRMEGRNVFYPMGWDDNGLPTERRVQNYFHVRCEPGVSPEPGLVLPMADEAARRHPPRRVSRANFIELCLALTAEDEKAFKALWRRLGLSVDWGLEYSTIEERSRRMAQWSFLDLLRKGEVYSDEAPTLWDVDFRTAVAQAEVEDRPQRGAFHRVRFGVEGGGSFVIATTRPELLAACVAVAAHADDERYRGLLGRRAVTPLFRAAVPIFGSPLVDPAKGTGILMVCTFGDATDVQWWREQGLPLRQIVGRDGHLVPVEFGSAAFPSLDPASASGFYGHLVGRTVKEAQKAIVSLLRDAAGSATGDGEPPLQGEPESVEHPVKFFEKGDRPLEFITTRQWFVRLLDHKEELIAAGDMVRWHPDFMRLRFRNWTENLQLDWCISRQRYFGVPFPVWYPVRPDGGADFSRPIAAEEPSLPVDPMTQAPSGYREDQRDQPGGFTAESDVFDTWFTSSLTPQIASRWFDAPERHRRLFPMDLRPQSHEIIRTWAFYSIVKAWLHEGTIPWRHAAISGWVLDPDRKKMSKSKGNVITPMHLLDQYGADAVRYWSLSARLGTDTAFDEKVLKVGRRLVTKLFNASRFVLAQTASGGPVARPLDVGFLLRVRDTAARATGALDEFDYAGALDVVERFFWGGFTDTYVEMVKARARSEEDAAGRSSAVAALRLGLSTLLRLFAPYLPYITEEVWSWSFAADGGARTIHRAPWPSPAEFASAPEAEEAGEVFDTACAFLETVHRAKSAAGATVGRHLARLRVAASPRTAARAARAIDDLIAAARVEDHAIEIREGMADGAFDLVEIKLAAPRGPE